MAGVGAAQRATGAAKREQPLTRRELPFTLAMVLFDVAAPILLMLGLARTTAANASLLVLLACVCWSFENNCTRMLSVKNPLEIVVIKGLCSGGTSLCITLFLGERLTAADAPAVLGALALGFVAYGLSIFFYIYAQCGLDAARTSAYYAVAPFIGVALSMLLCGERPGAPFFIALAVMAAGTYFASVESA